MDNMYYDADGNLYPKWVDEEAVQAARKFFTGNARDSIKSSQLRKFYSEFKTLERQLSHESFTAILPLVRLTKAKVAYAYGRKVVPLSFKEWLQKHVDAIKVEKDFKAFLLHFEAVVGFTYGEGLKDSQ